MRGVSTIVVGPVHAGIIEPGCFTFESLGETIVRLDVRLGFSRRGVEAALEGRVAVDAAYQVARICGGCSASRSWAYALALEAISNIECDEASGLARLVLAELERTYNHLFDLASICAGAGYGKGQMRGLQLKDRVVRLNAAFGGHRLLFDTIVPGGVRFGVLHRPRALRRELVTLSAEIERYAGELFRNGSLMKRLEGAGRVAPEDAARLNAVGPARRASGGAYDVRTSLPYGAYRTIAPAIIHHTAGDVAARAEVKYREALESLRLASLALDVLGDAAPGAPLPVRPGCGQSSAVTEGPRGAELVEIACDAGGAISRIRFSSASLANWPVVAQAMDGGIVPEFPLVNKSFNLCYACADL